MKSDAGSVYKFSAPLLDGRTIALADFTGRVLLIVNTASQCGFTPQYAGLEELYRAHRERGFEVLGFPCNQFGAQEPGTAEEIAAFCERNYGVSFPMFAKVDVNGEAAHPLFQYLKESKAGALGFGADQVELYEVPGRSRRKSGGPIRAFHQAGGSGAAGGRTAEAIRGSSQGCGISAAACRAASFCAAALAASSWAISTRRLSRRSIESRS